MPRRLGLPASISCRAAAARPPRGGPCRGSRTVRGASPSVKVASRWSSPRSPQSRARSFARTFRAQWRGLIRDPFRRLRRPVRAPNSSRPLRSRPVPQLPQVGVHNHWLSQMDWRHARSPGGRDGWRCPLGDRLADHDSIPFNALASEPFIALPPAAGPLRDFWLARRPTRCRAARRRRSRCPGRGPRSRRIRYRHRAARRRQRGALSASRHRLPAGHRPRTRGAGARLARRRHPTAA
jgi:hypothetical protein